jgi:hypothetical protein
LHDWLAPDEKKHISSTVNNARFEISKRWAFEHKDGANYDFFRNRIMFPIIHMKKGDHGVLEAGRSNAPEEKQTTQST